MIGRNSTIHIRSTIVLFEIMLRNTTILIRSIIFQPKIMGINKNSFIRTIGCRSCWLAGCVQESCELKSRSYASNLKYVQIISINKESVIRDSCYR